ncbi:MAG: DegT/DnrJ/EryC1/StrS family aminotransferase [Bacteroidetes bacterium]|nr:DegT/DnrJ/EryC1/StrS family aminotransferase [Bacteroidota bacterium]
MKIPFSLPVIDTDVINEMMDTLTNTGWLTTGPKTRALEDEIKKFTGAKETLCVNSWTSGAMLILRWFGVGPGDEVIIPAYTYSATALCVMNIGATVVMVDVKDDFTIDPEKIKKAITPRTKAIIPVDLGGWPCDYNRIYSIINDPEFLLQFTPTTERQKKLNRILILADAAHSLGAYYEGKKTGINADISIFSFHSVKNVTTGEGGGICINLPKSFNNHEELTFLRAFSLNGQNKSAYEKDQIGGWKYDIIDQGMKANMPDLCASVGLAQIRKYKNIFLPDRRRIFDYYTDHLKQYEWAIIPSYEINSSISSYHLYLLRIKGITENQRDKMIDSISKAEVGVNVHYTPMPMLTLFKNRGYKIEDYPKTFELYQNEITLPVYNGLTEEQLKRIVKVLIKAYHLL